MATRRKSGSGISDELLDQLLGGEEPKAAADIEGVIGTLKNAMAERMLNALTRKLTQAGRRDDGIPNSVKIPALFSPILTPHSPRTKS